MKLDNIFKVLTFVTASLTAFVSVASAADINEISSTLSETAETSGLMGMMSGLIGDSDVYWSWWLGAIFLGLITFLFWYLVRIPMSGSSSWQRIVGWREEVERQQVEKQFHEASNDDVMQAMMAETIAEFGEESVAKMSQGESASSSSCGASIPKRAPWQAHITFLFMIAVGGFVASLTSGTFELKMDMGREFASFFGEGPHTWALLVFGGVLIGFGTRMAGGCTIGHGLSGLSRLQIGSLIGTAAFMGGAIIVSFLIESMLS